MIFISDAKAAPLVGSTIVSGTLILNYIQDIVPYFSYVGITCGAILAVHGVVELMIGHYKRINKALHRDNKHDKPTH